MGYHAVGMRKVNHGKDLDLKSVLGNVLKTGIGNSKGIAKSGGGIQTE